MADFTLKQGDLGPSLFAQLLEPDPDNPGQRRPINLTGRQVQFRMRLKGSVGALKVDRAAVVTDAVNGRVRVDWAGADTDTVGLFVAELRVGTPQQTVPNDTHLVVSVIAPV